jgi:hypothetical protein
MANVLDGDIILLRTRKHRYLNTDNGVGPTVKMTDSHEHDPATSDELWWIECLNGAGTVHNGEPVLLRTRNKRYLNTANGRGPLVNVTNDPNRDPGVSDEIWWVERVDGPGELQFGDAVLLRTRKNRYLNTDNGVGPVVKMTDNHETNPHISDEIWWVEMGIVPVDEKVPEFPIVKSFSGARGSASVSIEDDGVVTLRMHVDTPRAGSTTRYVATALIAGYHDSDDDNVLTEHVEVHSLTLGSSPWHNSTKDYTWFLPSIRQEDVRNVRYVCLIVNRDTSESDFIRL